MPTNRCSYCGWATAAEEDNNFDGKTDVWYSYSNANTSLIRFDADSDGQADCETRFIHGVPVESRWTASNQLGYWKRDFFTNGTLRQSDIDRDRDGSLDERVFFDAYDLLIRTVPLK